MLWSNYYFHWIICFVSFFPGQLFLFFKCQLGKQDNLYGKWSKGLERWFSEQSVICVSVRTWVLIPNIYIYITVGLLCIHDPSVPVELWKAETGDCLDAHGTASLGEPSRETTRKPLLEWGGGWGAAPGVVLSPSHMCFGRHIFHFHAEIHMYVHTEELKIYLL